MRTFTNLRARVVRLAFSPEGTTLAAVVRGAMQVGVWELPGGAFRRWHPYIDGAVSTLGYSPSGKWLVVGGEVGLVLPYIRARENYDSEMYAGRPVDSVAFSSRVVPGRTVLAVGGNRVRLYDLDAPYGDKKSLWDAELPSPEGWFRSVTFHPTADVLIGCDTVGRVIHVWNPVKRERLRPPVSRAPSPTAVAFSATGERVLAAYGQHVQLIDTEIWGTRKVCEHARGKVTDVAASPRGDWFATSGTDATIRLWDASTGKPGRVYDWKAGAVTAVAFSPDGLTCAAGGENGQVTLWDVDA